MSKLTYLIVAGLALPAIAQEGSDPWGPYRSTKVLYAGAEGGSRERVFESFLREWFDDVGTIPLDTLSMDTAADYDVVIVDWKSQYGKDGYEAREGGLHRAPAQLGPEFTKPFVAMTYVGTQVRGRHKLDWL